MDETRKLPQGDGSVDLVTMRRLRFLTGKLEKKAAYREGRLPGSTLRAILAFFKHVLDRRFINQ